MKQFGVHAFNEFLMLFIYIPLYMYNFAMYKLNALPLTVTQCASYMPTTVVAFVIQKKKTKDFGHEPALAQCRSVEV